MSGPRDDHWEDALGWVERSVGECLAALDRYEAAFAGVLADAPPTLSARPANPDGPAAGWDDLLSAAKQRATDVERTLAEQEAEWGRWRAALADWRRQLQHPPGAEPGEAEHGQGGGGPAGGG